MAAQKECCVNSTTSRLCHLIRQGNDVDVILPFLRGVNLDAKDSDGNTPLLLAAIHCEKDIFKLLYQCEANVKITNRDGCNVLHYASRNGWGKIVRSLLNHNWVRSKMLQVNETDRRGNTAMHYASSSGQLKIVQYLKWKKVNCKLKNHVGFTPLLCAAEKSHYDVFNFLFDCSEINENNGRLLLYYAVQNNWRDIVLFLLRRVPDLNETFRTVKMLFIPNSNEHLELVKLLLGEGTVTKVLARMICRAALYHASCKGHLEVVEWIVKEVPGFSARDYCGDEPLHAASTNGHLEIVKCLLETGVDVNTRLENDATALHGASMNGHLGIVKRLLEGGIDMEAKTDRGRTALHWASMNGHLGVVKCLVEKGADIHAKCFGDGTPLLYAAFHQHKDIVFQLLELGANIDRLNGISCSTILLYATKNMWVDVVKSVLKRGCKVDERDHIGGTALKCASLLLHMDIAQALLQAGASWDMEDDYGKSPFNYLFMREKKDINLVKLFVENGAYFKPADYDAIVKSSSLEVLQDVKLCCQAVINKFNNYDFPELYKLLGSKSLPHISKMKVKCDSEVARSIERTVEFEIQTNGHCNVLQVRPIALNVFSVRSVLEYCKEKRCCCL